MKKDIEFGKQLVEAFKKLNASIFKYIYVRVGYKKELAQDLTQDVFEKAWKARDGYNKELSSLKNWLFVIARNKVIDFYRSSKRGTVTINEDIAGLASTDSVEDKVVFENILINLRKLSEKEQELITLYYISDLGIEEMAVIMGKKYGAIKIAIYRALKKLKKLCL